MSLILLLHAANAFTQNPSDDAAGLTDNVSTQSDHFFSVTDSLGLSDTNTQVGAHFLTITDDSGVKDSLGLGPVTDALGLTDNTSFSISLTLNDLLGGTDSAAESAGRGQSVTDQESLTDSTSMAVSYSFTFTDTLGASDGVGLFYSTTIATDNVGLVDPFTPPKLLNTSASDDAGLTDIFSYSLNSARSISITDDVGSTDSSINAGSRFLSITDLLAGSDTAVSQRTSNVNVTDDVGSTDTFGAVDTPPQNWTQSITDSAGATDALSSTAAYFRSVTDLEAGSDSATTNYNHTAVQVALSRANLTDTLSFAKTISKTITDNVGVDDTDDRTHRRGQHGHVLHMVEYITRMED